MKVGVPKGLLYYKYYPFIHSFFNELGADIVASGDTNKTILDEGVKYCVDEACLPIKIFHGHVASIRNQCDLMFVPRIMQLRQREYICPKFCGLPEMVVNSIPDLPEITTVPIYAHNNKVLFKSVLQYGLKVTKNKKKIQSAYHIALEAQKKFVSGVCDTAYQKRIALVGHPYNIYDTYTNMNIIKKLNKMSVGVITEEHLEQRYIDEKVSELFKKPFWTFARNAYGYAVHMAESNKIQGIIYISSFACGIDSVIIDLIKDKVGEFPMLILKIDEHTGEAGFDTRLEAFVDMLERRQ